MIPLHCHSTQVSFVRRLLISFSDFQGSRSTFISRRFSSIYGVGSSSDTRGSSSSDSSGSSSASGTDPLGQGLVDDGGGPPSPIPNRPLRGQRRINHESQQLSSSKGRRQSSTDDLHDDDKRMNKPFRSSSLQFLNQSLAEEKRDGLSQSSFLDKFKLGVDKKEKPLPSASQEGSNDNKNSPEPPPQDVDEIFKKMKETGLIPNAVAMLDGLCKDGLVQEAMKLFGLMREKGTIPEVVIYTAVVEGFCKAQKPDDAKRIFRKMQNNGISPNAFSYAVLIRGLSKCNKLEDATDFSMEMLGAGHSPNVATFVGLVDGISREKGVEEASAVIGSLRQKGFFLDEKAVREYLDKKAPSMPLVWETIFGKKSSQRSF